MINKMNMLHLGETGMDVPTFMASHPIEICHPEYTMLVTLEDKSGDCHNINDFSSGYHNSPEYNVNPSNNCCYISVQTKVVD